MRARLKQTKQQGKACKEIVILGKRMKALSGYYWFISNNVKDGITVAKVNENKLEFYDKVTQSYI